MAKPNRRRNYVETRLGAIFVFASAYLTLFGLPVWVAIKRGDILLGGTFSILGGLVAWGIVWAWRYHHLVSRFGAVTYYPATAPARPGGVLLGRVRFNTSPPSTATIGAELRCIRVKWSPGGRGGLSTSEEIVWTASGEFPVVSGEFPELPVSETPHADVRFALPADARPTDLPGERPAGDEQNATDSRHRQTQYFHRWEVAIKGVVPGASRWFPVRVIVDPAESPVRGTPGLSSA